MIVTAEDAAYNRYINEKVAISPTQQHCSYDVTFDSDMSADLKFQLGNIGDAASIGAHDVHTDVCQGISVQDDGKYASRFSTKPSGGFCAVLPYISLCWIFCNRGKYGFKRSDHNVPCHD